MKKLILAVALLLPACRTEFVGDAYFPGGPQGCHDACQQAGLEMGSFIYSGEFSSSCVCRVRGQASAASDSAGDAAAAGVVMQQQRSSEQNSGAGH
jgi:hypothetical protein